MIEQDDYFCQVLDLTLNKEQRTELLELLHKHEFASPYIKEYDGQTDNNFFTPAENLPNWFLEKAKKYLDIGWPVFLKNKGYVPWHKDEKRKCSITIPLTYSNTPTSFKHLKEKLANDHRAFNSPGEEIYLHHNYDSYLQNNQRYHLVRRDAEWRCFLQISFNEPYSEIRKML